MKKINDLVFSDENYDMVMELLNLLAEKNTNDTNTGDYNTGNYNIGNFNTGDRNTGSCNTGSGNAGSCNTGRHNTGYYNTGDRNTGHFNTGSWNSCNSETGYFNTIQYNTVRVFNKPCDLSVWEKANKPKFINFIMEEGKSYKKAFKESYLEAKKKDDWEEQKQLLLDLPNFNKDVFKIISSIDIEED